MLEKVAIMGCGKAVPTSVGCWRQCNGQFVNFETLLKIAWRNITTTK